MFAFRLALALGMTVRQLLASMDSAELSEWMAFDSIQPIGERGAYMRAGLIASVVANTSMSPPKRRLTPLDFMPGREADGPTLLDDPQAQSALIQERIFGVKRGV